MTLANDSILVTPGSGATIATHLAGGKEHQVIVEADHLGHIKGSRDGFLLYFTAATNAANRRVGDLFNADATAIVRVQGIWIIPTLTAITGVQIGFGIKRTSAVGTGGTVETPRKLDESQGNLNANITARSGATGGATVVYTYFPSFFFNDETNAGAGFVAYQNQLPVIADKVVEIVLRQNQGLMVQQDITQIVGLTGALMYFVVE